jgi:hypothetical protein
MKQKKRSHFIATKTGFPCCTKSSHRSAMAMKVKKKLNSMV